MPPKWNITADNLNPGSKYLLGKNVDTKEEAEHWARVYKSRYEGKRFPNDKGAYTYCNFRAVEIEDAS